MKAADHPLSWSAIFRVVTTGLVLFLAWYLSDIIMMIVLALMIASALYPLVRFFNRKLSLTLSSVLVILMLFLPFIVIIISVVPSFVSQFPDLLKTLNTVVQNSPILPESVRSIDLTQYTQTGFNYLFNSTSVITGALTTFLTIIFLSLYFLIDSTRLRQIMLDLIPDSEEAKVEELINKLSSINGYYIRGNLLISSICGLFITTGLLILNVPFAIPLGLFAGLVDLLPLIGALIGMVPAVILAFAISPTTGILVLLLFLIYQQIENNILAPSIYNKALDLSPALSFIAVIVGTALFGIAGAFISLPIAASLPTIARYIAERRRH